MKKYILLLVILTLSFAACTAPAAETQTPAAGTANAELYYGQKPPGLVPEVFAPGVISTSGDMEFACTFTPDGSELYYSVRKGKTEDSLIMVSRLINGNWTVPVKFDVPAEGKCMEPHITRDGKTMYFGGQLKLPGEDTARQGIWQMKRTGDSWDSLSYVTDGMYVSTTEDGSIYLTDVFGTGTLVKLQYNVTGFDKRVVLKGGPNSPVPGVHPCVAPDESFIIFDHDRPDGSEGDLFVSFNNGDGTWSESFSLGDTVNSAGIEFCASLSPDGKYIFFMKDYDIYWVDAKIIDQFRPL